MSGRGPRSLVEAVADAVRRLEVLRVLRVGLDLLPQARHVEVDRARHRQPVVAPDLAQEALPADGLAALLDQQLEDLPLEIRQALLLAPSARILLTASGLILL